VVKLASSPVPPRLRAGLAGARLRVRPWVVNDLGRRIYVLPRDHRAWRLAVAHGALDRDAIEAWRLLVRSADPDLVLDIGANYGEVVLSATYPAAAEIAVVEPNPELVSLLRRSISSARLDATVHAVAASDQSGEATLNLFRRSTGTSTLETNRPPDRTVTVETATIDDLVGPGHERCVFKIDVEGHESSVLAGMAKTLASCRSWRGLIEHGRRGTLIDLSFAPHVYALRLADMAFVALDDEVRVAMQASDGPYSKDLVVSTDPI
jgi:FkbM family methyltransferase